jgi:hypothetical protein
MTRLAWMTAASVGSWLLVTALSRTPVNPEVLYGMLGPLAASLVTWGIVERVHAAAPPRVMGALVAGFAGKMLFFGVYVVVMLRVAGLRPVPFIVSFTAYFIGLYVLQALFLRRLR